MTTRTNRERTRAAIRFERNKSREKAKHDRERKQEMATRTYEIMLLLNDFLPKFNVFLKTKVPSFAFMVTPDFQPEVEQIISSALDKRFNRSNIDVLTLILSRIYYSQLESYFNVIGSQDNAVASRVTELTRNYVAEFMIGVEKRLQNQQYSVFGLKDYPRKNQLLELIKNYDLEFPIV